MDLRKVFRYQFTLVKREAHMTNVRDIANWFLSHDSMTHKKCRSSAITLRPGIALFMTGVHFLATRYRRGYMALESPQYILFTPATNGRQFQKLILTPLLWTKS